MDLQQALEWYAELARTPGWKEYTWHRVKELARDHPSVFWRLPELLVQEMQRSAADGEPTR